MSSFDELKIKYPLCNYAPLATCKTCGGSGEVKKHLPAGKFFQERDVITPCMCIFVEHDMLEIAKSVMQETVSKLKGGEG